MQLTQHFSLAEFTRSATATQRGIDNTLDSTSSPQAEEVIANLRNLCEKVLEPLRVWYGKPITIGSGYRCPALNRAVGGVPHSQHQYGEAADLQVTCNVSKSNPSAYNAELRKLFNYIRSSLPHDQLILERNSPSSKTFWIHVSCKRDVSKNRGQVIELLNKYAR